jgi:hypothetical protein
MELIKKIINLGDLRNKKTPLIYELLTKDLREKGCCKGLNNKQIILQNAEKFDSNWGRLDFEYIYINVFLTQNIDDMGLFTDVPYVTSPGAVDYTLIQETYPNFVIPPSVNQIFSASTTDPYIRYFARLNGQTESDFYAAGGIITGLTDDKLFSVTSYITSTPLIPGFNLSIDPNYFVGVDVNGLFTNYTAYTIDAQIGNIAGTGLHYKTYNFNRLLFNSTINTYFSIPYTEVSYQSEGWNSSNTSLSAITKEEIYFGIVFPPKVENNVFIDRGTASVFERHSRIRSVLTMEQLELYGNGYYNLV